MRRLLLLILLCSAAALGQPPAEEIQLSVHTFPHCEVYLDTPTGLTFLGHSREPFRMRAPVLRDPHGNPVQYASGVVVLKAPAHGELRIPVGAQDWAAGRLPSSGRLRLPPDSLGVAAEDVIRGYPLPVLVAFLVLTGGFWWLWVWRRLARQRAAEVQELSSRLNTSGDPLIGKNLGRFRVAKRLGQGGMGAVYRVEDESGAMAAKVIYTESMDRSFLDRFRREFRLLSQLRHPAFPRCFDYHEQEGLAYCLMELVTGRTLREYITPDGLPWDTVRPWIRQILEGLHYAHEQGVVHRDLKPENLMLEGNRVRILDFGLARKADVTAITMTGDAFGTPRYIAPEQLSAGSKDVDRRTDIYSLGVIIYELLAGAPPFSSEDTQALIRMHLREPPPPLQVAGLPEKVALVVGVMLAKNPANRYPTAQRVLEELESGDSQDTVGLRRPSN